MALGDLFAPATGMFSNSLGGFLSYAWILLPVVFIIGIVGVVWILKSVKKKKTQWTHRLKVRRVLQNNLLSDSIILKMRRFPLVKKAEVFELETPLLGGYLIPELDQYSGDNEFSIILDKNNRIYTNQGEYFNPDKSSVNVSAKHSEIDIQRSNLKSDFQNINKISDRIQWSTIAKYAFLVILVLAVAVVLIVGISKWGEAQKSKVEEAKAIAQTMQSLEKVMITVESTVNTQKLEILPLLKEIYKDQNIQNLINTDIYQNETA